MLFALVLASATAFDLRSAIVPLSKSSLSVSVEVRTADVIDAVAVRELSQKLRANKAAALWTNDVSATEVLAKEQATAVGDFPGPCPLVYNGDASEAAAAVAAGASAVVLSPSEAGRAADFPDVEQIWRVTCAADVEALGNASFFLVDGDDAVAAAEVAAAVPEGAVVVAEVGAMQPESGEIDAARRAQADLGARAVVLRGACVGDDEDVTYSSFAIGRLRAKRSSSFSMDGFTGTTNGHFGTSYGGESKPRPWKRATIAA